MLPDVHCYHWHSQKLCKAPAPSGVESGEGCPFPSRLEGLGECCELPQWVRGKAPAANAFSAFLHHRMLLVERKMWLWCSMNYWYNNNLSLSSPGGNGYDWPPGYATDCYDFTLSYAACVNYLQVHPDMNRGDPDSKEKFLRVQDAYTVLSSADSRRAYDTQLERSRMPQSYSSRYSGDFVPSRQAYYRFVVVAVSLHCKRAYSIALCLSVGQSVCPCVLYRVRVRVTSDCCRW